MPLMFEQQPRESAKAFAAFKAYLELGPERSLAAVGEKLGKSKVMMEKWSRKFDWPARVAAHGAHLALVEREAAEAVPAEALLTRRDLAKALKVSTRTVDRMLAAHEITPIRLRGMLVRFCLQDVLAELRSHAQTSKHPCSRTI